MVRRLVQQQRGRGSSAGIRRGEQDSRQLNPAALPAGQGAELLRQDPFSQAEAGADAGGFAFCGVAAQRHELLFELAVTTDRAVTCVVVGDLGHQCLLLLQVGEQYVQPAGRQHTVAGQHVEIAFFGILRQVTNFTDAGDRSCVRFAFSRQNAQRRGLTRTVAPHQPDAVAGLHPQIGAVG